MRTVEFRYNSTDYAAVMMAEMGFSTKYICETLDLTPSQVSYRIAVAGGGQRYSYRNGHSDLAKAMLRNREKVLNLATTPEFREHRLKIEHNNVLQKRRVKNKKVCDKKPKNT